MGLYDDGLKLVKNKDIAVNNFVSYNMARCIHTFNWTNIPDRLTSTNIEKVIQKNGFGVITSINDDIVIVPGVPIGNANVYGEYEKYAINIPSVGINKILDNPLIIKNDSYNMGLYPIILKYGTLLTDAEISLQLINVLTRVNMLISASDDTTKASADLFFKKINDGDYTVIGENSFFDGVKLQQPQSTYNTASRAIEIYNHYKTALDRLLGYNLSNNFKRERLLTDEINGNDKAVLSFIYDMYFNRLQAVEKINNRLSLNIGVEFGGVFSDNNIINDTNNGNINDSNDVSGGVSDDNSSGKMG